MSKLAFSVTLACLLAVVALARGDEPAAVPEVSMPTQEQATKATPEASTNSQPESAAPNVIVIETTPELERSEVIGKLIEGLEKDGIAKRSEEDLAGKPVDFHAVINARPDLPGDKIRTLIETLKALSIGSARIQLIPADGVSDVIVICPADVTYQRVRTLQEMLTKQGDFKVDVRVAHVGPVTSLGPTLFTVPPPQTTLGRLAQPFAGQGAGGEFGSGFGGAGGESATNGLEIPESAIPGRNWVDGGTLIVAISDDGAKAFGYSEQHPRWAGQDLEALPNAKAIPVVGQNMAAVMHGHFCHAYSPTRGKWDTLKLPVGETAVPHVGDDSVWVHSVSQGDYVFKNAWGKWFSAEEIKAGRVAEYLLTQRNAAPADQAIDMRTGEVTVFHLKFVEAKEAARIVRQLFDGVVNPAVEERTNSLLVASDDPLAVRKVEELLKAIDLRAPKGVDIDSQSSVGGANEKADELRGKLAELEQRTQDLAARLRGPLPDPATGDRLNDELRDTVKQAFEARQKLQRAELAEFAKRLQGIQQSIEMRDRISQQIIDRRVEELLDPNLKWDSAQPDEFIKSLPPHALLFVTAEWSVACQRLKPTIENLKKRGLVTQAKNEVTIHATIDQSAGQPLAIIEIDVTRRDSLQRTLGVKELPVLIVWHDGRETTRHEGYEDIAKVLLELQAFKAGDKNGKREPIEKPPSESVGTREAASLDDAIKVFNEKYADNPFCRVQPKLSPFEVTGAIRLALDRETSADLPASELAQLRSIAEKRIVPAGWQFEIYTVTQHVTDETFLQTSIGLTLIRSDGTASTHEIRRLLNEPADGTEDGRTRVLGLYDVGHMPLWTQDGKKQHAGLLIRYLKKYIDPSSWENGTTIAVHDAAALSLVVHASRKNQNEIARTLESIVPIKVAMEDRRLDMIRYPIGDLPLWSQDGKGQNIPLLGDYLQSVDPRVGWGAADDGHSLCISVTDEEGRKKIADAIDVLRAEMLRDRPAALVKARESHRAAANAQANETDGSRDPRQTQVVAQIPGAAYTRPTADDQRATAMIPAEAWGEPVNGLRVAIVLQSPSIDKHQRLCYDIVAENVSDKDIRFGVTLGVDDWHNYCKTKLADADGNPLVQQAGSRLRLPSTLKRLWLKPKERGVISSWATGLLKQDEKEQLPAPWYFRVKPGRYSVSAEVELGPNMNSTDPTSGKRTVLSPAQGEWSGKLQTGAAAVELFTQPVPADQSAAKHPLIEFRSTAGVAEFRTGQGNPRLSSTLDLSLSIPKPDRSQYIVCASQTRSIRISQCDVSFTSLP